MTRRRYCEVSLNSYSCKAPPAYRIGVGGIANGDRSCKGTCSICGNACCTECSTVTVVRGKRKRICEDCKEANAQEEG